MAKAYVGVAALDTDLTEVVDAEIAELSAEVAVLMAQASAEGLQAWRAWVAKSLKGGAAAAHKLAQGRALWGAAKPVKSGGEVCGGNPHGQAPRTARQMGMPVVRRRGGH